jgi:hypothetical protein
MSVPTGSRFPRSCIIVVSKGIDLRFLEYDSQAVVLQRINDFRRGVRCRVAHQTVSTIGGITVIASTTTAP